MSEKNSNKYKMKSGTGAALAVALAVLFCFFSAGCAEEQEDSLEELSISAENDSEESSPEGTGKDGSAAEETGDSSDPSQNAGSADAQDTREKVYVYVCGAVNAPGVYELRSGARVFEAIQLAGGLTGEAAPDAVNQARTVSDGEQIRVPTAQEFQEQGAGVGETVTEGSENKKVNINTAGKEELMTLTGIGESKAQSILDYREENGKFGSIEELMQIQGIKEGVFNKIKDDITV